jgi:hypothetical protein
MNEMTEARLAANRANAKLSTGPRTDEGRRRSSQNAVRHGLFGRASVLEGEERQAYLDFTGAIVDSLEPGTAMERQLAERIADQEWRLMRIEAITEALLAPGVDAGEEEPDPVDAAAREFRERPGGIATLSIYEQRLARMAREARKELREMQAARQSREEDQMDDAVEFYRLHKMLEMPWKAEEYGFVFRPGAWSRKSGSGTCRMRRWQRAFTSTTSRNGRRRIRKSYRCGRGRGKASRHPRKMLRSAISYQPSAISFQQAAPDCFPAIIKERESTPECPQKPTPSWGSTVGSKMSSMNNIGTIARPWTKAGSKFSKRAAPKWGTAAALRSKPARSGREQRRQRP